MCQFESITLIIIYFIASETILNARLIGFATPFIALPAGGVWDWVPGLVNPMEGNRAAAILTHVVQIPGRSEGRSAQQPARSCPPCWRPGCFRVQQWRQPRTRFGRPTIAARP